MAPPLPQELSQSERVYAKTRYGTATGGRAKNGAAVFLGESVFRSEGGGLPECPNPRGPVRHAAEAI